MADREADLSPEQARVVDHDIRGGHLLVLARPGSGKTHTLAARVRRLICDGVDARSIVSVTFSRRAAEELKSRLPPCGIWAGTFHAICADVLERDGAAVGIQWPFRIADEARSREFLARAAIEAGLPLPKQDRQRSGLLRTLSQLIERRKRLGLSGEAGNHGGSLDGELMARVDAAYCLLLREANALDFADLITEAAHLLEEDKRTAEDLRSRLSHVLVDEFHDVSPEQYRLITLLAPPRAPAQVFVVADPDQAIYSWRGADANRILARYRFDYRPATYELTLNFRSAEPIVVAADDLMRDCGRTKASRAQREGRYPPTACEHLDPRAEGRAVVNLTRRALSEGRYRGYGAFAVLFRTHAIGDQVEAELLQAGVPLWRVQPDRFFQDEDARESIRFLELALGLQDDEFEPAMNWPRVIVDEVTMAHLRRLAAQRGLRLTELVRRIEELGDEVSPLTRHAIREFNQSVDRDLRQLHGQTMREALPSFLAALMSRRSPIAAAERPQLRDTLDYLARGLADAVAALAVAIATDRPIAMQTSGDADTWAAEIIARHSLTTYFERPPQPAGNVASGTFVLTLGQEKPADATGVGIGRLETRTGELSVAARTWRLMQLTLMARETLDRERFLLFDLETGSLRVDHANILELCALPFVNGEVAGEGMHSLLRPSAPDAIEPSASDIHGLRWQDVAAAPLPEDALPTFLDALASNVVVGHAIEEFDLPVLRIAAERVGLPFRQPAVLDVVRLARRLWPDEMSYRIEDLARKIDPTIVQTHRAETDCRLTGMVFARLLADARRDRELDVLHECLPLVAAAISTSTGVVAYDDYLLNSLGERALARGKGEELLAAWESRLGPDRAAVARAAMLAARAPAADEDERWARLANGWESAVSAFETSEPRGGIDRFLWSAALAQPIDAVPPQGAGEDAEDPRGLGPLQRVALLTVHSAKGLEWDVVFVVGCEDDQLPPYWARDDEAMAEERRVLYVAMTRARDRLFLFSAACRNGFAKAPSRFLVPLVGRTIELRQPALLPANRPDTRDDLAGEQLDRLRV